MIKNINDFITRVEAVNTELNSLISDMQTVRDEAYKSKDEQLVDKLDESISSLVDVIDSEALTTVVETLKE